jgi:MoaA/NifB/PqqE/SkfB family radical SAM enzyme
MTPFDFNRTPFLVIWEVTRACALACVHCRADAIPRRNPGELSTAEGFRLIDQIRALGTPPPLFVLTGGDPMRRPDLAELVGYAAGTGLTVALTPSGTAAATPARLAALKAAGLSRVAVSLDGPTPETHDAFRRVGGSYAWTTRIIEAAIHLDLPLQINSTISKRTLPTWKR